MRGVILPDIDIIVIGAGVNGLAIAAELAPCGQGIFVLEKNRTFGLETSSHNSEVIHAGFYYPTGTMKAGFCVDGNSLLYKICEQYHIEHRKITKIIVAADESESRELQLMYEQGQQNGVQGLRLLSREEIKKMEPAVTAVAGLYSPSTGIIDSWGLMRCYQGRAFENGVSFVFNTEVVAIEKIDRGYRVVYRDQEGIAAVTARIVINCGGLFCDQIAVMAGIDIDKSGYRIHYCRGSYFSLDARIGRQINRLVYPVPEQAGKGIHITLNLEGQTRLGPNVKYMDRIDYSVDAADQAHFFAAVKRYLPAVEYSDLIPDFSGVRPKLQGPGEDFRDFIIREESDRGLPGLINLIGIESPGLTASPAIARYVAAIVRWLN